MKIHETYVSTSMKVDSIFKKLISIVRYSAEYIIAKSGKEMEKQSNSSIN